MIASVSIGTEIGRAQSFAAGSTWELLWALILGFTLSGVVQTGRFQTRDASLDAGRCTEDPSHLEGA